MGPSKAEACAPKNLGEEGKQCLLQFWPVGLGAVGSEVVPKTQQMFFKDQGQ